MISVVDGVPAVGHVKGGIHYICGDKEGGDRVMKAASRTVGVIGGGALGGLTGGPAGAVLRGLAGGATMDSIITGVDSAVHKEYRPSGHIATVTKIYKGEATSGDIFDAAVTIVVDGMTGYYAGEAASKIREKICTKKMPPKSMDTEKMPHETSDTTDMPHKTPDTTDMPHKTPDTTDMPHKTPDTTDMPHKTPDTTDMPHKTPDTTDMPHKTPDTTDIPHKTPDTTDMPHKTPDTRDIPHTFLDELTKNIPPFEIAKKNLWASCETTRRVA